MAGDEETAVKSKAVDAELAAKGAALKIHIEHSDMPEEMQETLKQMVRDAFVQATVYKDLASSIKQHFEKKYPPPDNKATSGVYHCVVGASCAQQRRPRRAIPAVRSS